MKNTLLVGIKHEHNSNHDIDLNMGRVSYTKTSLKMAFSIEVNETHGNPSYVMLYCPVCAKPMEYKYSQGLHAWIARLRKLTLIALLVATMTLLLETVGLILGIITGFGLMLTSKATFRRVNVGEGHAKENDHEVLFVNKILDENGINRVLSTTDTRFVGKFSPDTSAEREQKREQNELSKKRQKERKEIANQMKKEQEERVAQEKSENKQKTDEFQKARQELYAQTHPSFTEKILSKLNINFAIEIFNKINPRIAYSVRHNGPLPNISSQEIGFKNSQRWEATLNAFDPTNQKYQCLLCNEVFDIEVPSFEKIHERQLTRIKIGTILTFLATYIAFIDVVPNGEIALTSIEFLITGFIGVPLISLFFNFLFNKLYWEMKKVLLSTTNGNHKIRNEKFLRN